MRLATLVTHPVNSGLCATKFNSWNSPKEVFKLLRTLETNFARPVKETGKRYWSWILPLNSLLTGSFPETDEAREPKSEVILKIHPGDSVSHNPFKNRVVYFLWSLKPTFPQIVNCQPRMNQLTMNWWLPLLISYPSLHEQVFSKAYALNRKPLTSTTNNTKLKPLLVALKSQWNFTNWQSHSILMHGIMMAYIQLWKQIRMKGKSW